MNLTRCSCGDVEGIGKEPRTYLTRHERNEEPVHERQSANGEHENEPEPKEEEDLLVEHVDHEHTLHSVMVYIAQHTYLEVAQRNAWKIACFMPFFAGQNLHERELLGSSVKVHACVRI